MDETSSLQSNSNGVHSGDDEALPIIGQETVSPMSTIHRVQQFCIIFSHAASLVSIIIVLRWISQLGGFASINSTGQAKLVFNWHPVLMITAFFFMTVASLSYRLPCRSTNRTVQKTTHALAWSTAALCATIALLAVFRSHNDEKSGYIANLYSLHSWFGVTVILFYIIQFTLSFFTFAWRATNITQTFANNVMRVHLFVGPFIYLLTATTILLGIQEKEGFVGCSYKVTQPDRFPTQHLAKIPAPCLTSHALALTVLAVTLSTSIALYDFSDRPVRVSRRVEAFVLSPAINN